MSEELIWMTADEMRKAYRAKAISPVEVVNALLEHLDQADPSINAFVTVTASLALTQAKAAEAEFARGTRKLPELYGIPISVKDLTDTAGVRTTYGSVRYVEHVPDSDSIAWSRLKTAGTILLGKTTTPEFGQLGVTESKLTGTTGNPWDPTKTSGGSSGGSAAATVAGIGPLAWGSDGGGSIRVPASVCGAVGIKPSTGRIPEAGNAEPDTTDGPLARSVVDAAMMLDATVGHHPDDRLSIPSRGELFAEAAREVGDLSNLRIAANLDLNQGPVDPQVRRVFENSLRDLQAAGAVVEYVDIKLPDAIEYFIDYWGPEYIQDVKQLKAEGVEVWPKMESVATKAQHLNAQQVSAAFRETKTAIYNAYRNIFKKFDLMVTPTTPIPAFKHAGDLGGIDVVDGIEVNDPAFFFHRLTEPPSHAGLPAISVPCGFTEEGLPVGLQFVGPLYEDLAVIRAAARYEQATTWTSCHPESSKGRINLK